MRYTILTISFFILLLPISCRKDPKPYDSAHSIMILQFNYTDYNLNGAAYASLNFEPNCIDTIPIIEDYVPPGDFGSLKLYYSLDSILIFNGSIVWAGEGEMYFPENLISPEELNISNSMIVKPDSARFQLFHDNLYYPVDGWPIDSLWPNVQRIYQVQDYLCTKNRIGLLKYMPGVGSGDPNTWKWLLYFFK